MPEVLYRKEACVQKAGSLLEKKGWKLALAESCTGGLVSHSITSVSGCSSYFAGGVIAYANRIKIDLIGVDSGLLNVEGAVSEIIALQMAQGIKNLFAVDAGLSLTGIAGPDGGTDTKPVGLVYIGVSIAGSDTVARFVFKGDRVSIKEQAAGKALEMLVDRLESSDSSA